MKRKTYTPDEKVGIIRRHLLDAVAVSDLCDEHDLNPTMYYRWQKEFFEGGAAAFAKESNRQVSGLKQRLADAESRLARKNEVLAEVMEEYVRCKKKRWGPLSGRWVEWALRDEVVGFVAFWAARTELSSERLLSWLGLRRGKYHDWRARRGRGNGHNGAQPRHFWLLEHERDAIIAFAVEHPLEGYRRLTYMMLDADVVAVSPSSVYRVLKQAGLLGRGASTESAKGKGFAQPSAPHVHWHIDVSYINLAGTFYYLCAVLDGYSRYIVHWELRERMQETDIEIILQRARERVGDVSPRIISDNGPQFIANDFKAYIRLMGMSHVRTAPFYPQSNGKLERWHQSLKRECIRPKSPVSLADARRLVGEYVRQYNEVRLHSAIGYIAPKDRLEGRDEAIRAARKAKLAQAAAVRRAVNNAEQQHGAA